MLTLSRPSKLPFHTSPDYHIQYRYQCIRSNNVIFSISALARSQTISSPPVPHQAAVIRTCSLVTTLLKRNMLRLSRILRHAYEASYAKETLPAIIFLLSSPPSSLLLPVPIFLDRVVPSARVAGRLRCNDIYTPFYTSSLSLIEELLSSSLSRA